MLKKGFSVGEVLKFGLQEWKKNWAFLLGVTLFAIIIPLIPQMIRAMLNDDALVAKVILGGIHFILGIMAAMGMLTVALKVARQEPVTFNDFFSTSHLVLSYLWGSILYFLAVSFGLVFLIIPGIIFGVKFNLWPFFILDRSFKGVESLKASSQAVNGAKWDLFLFGIAAFFLNILGILCVGLGILIAWPVILIAWSKVYLILTTPSIATNEEVL